VICTSLPAVAIAGARSSAPLGDGTWFLQVLEEVRQRCSFVVVAYVVMPEHFHLLISEPETRNPSLVMQAVKIGFARRVINREDLPPGSATGAHIWQRRFYDFNVLGREKRVEELRYIHRNPVRRGLVQNPEDWPWSSFRSYAYSEHGPVVVNDWSVLKMKVRARRKVNASSKSEVIPNKKPHFSQKAREMGTPMF